jgi:hypothetical protein
MKSPLKMLEQHRTSGVLVDANLVYLFFVGTVRRALVGKAPHTDGYSVEDYDRLSAMLGWFRHRYVTPNVLTEVSNLAGKLEGNHRRAVWIIACWSSGEVTRSISDSKNFRCSISSAPWERK